MTMYAGDLILYGGVSIIASGCIYGILFSKEKRFKRYMRKREVFSIEEVFQYVFVPLEWKYDHEENEMIAYPIPDNKHVCFYFREHWSETNFYFQVLYKKEKMFVISYDTEYKDNTYVYDHCRYSKSEETFQKFHTDVMEHLQEIYQNFKTKGKQQQKEIEKIQKQNEEKVLKRKRSELMYALTTSQLWDKKQYHDFKIESFQNESYQFISLLFEDMPIFNATHKNGEFSYQFLNQDTKQYEILASLEEGVVSHFHKKMKKDYQAADFQNEIEHTKQEIEKKIAYLKGFRHWLSEESKHLLEQTHTRDIESLFSTYEEVVDKSAIHTDVMDSLRTIQSSLQKIEEEIENRKVEDIQKRKRIIEAR